MFKYSKLSFLAVLAVAAATTQARATTVAVDALDNIYGAGQGSAPGGGNLPAFLAVSGGSTVTFGVTGTVSLNSQSNFNDADGVGAAVSGSFNTGSGSISGINAPNAGYLVGLFVPAGGPSGSAPASLDFTGSGGTSFTSLSPLLDQVFFIGDGLTGDGTGSAQSFLAPAGASTLYLGISDACGYNGSPSCYTDNSGTFNVSVSAVPLPPALPMFGAVIAGLAGFGVRRARRAVST